MSSRPSHSPQLARVGFASGGLTVVSIDGGMAAVLSG